MSSGDSILGNLFGLAAALVFVLLLAWPALALLKRLQVGTRRGAQSSLKVLSAVAVGARERVALVEHEGRRYLVGVAPGSVRLIDRVDAAASGTATTPAGEVARPD
jgi:flagellar protein FliO/FliZ